MRMLPSAPLDDEVTLGIEFLMCNDYVTSCKHEAQIASRISAYVPKVEDVLQLELERSGALHNINWHLMSLSSIIVRTLSP